ncbi:MAG: hypothetical protein HGGPFJEG_01714 [Ignavibacteria bacterium]|nr:hypothetical protein [Ignavibacteria bacterium]
MKKYLLILTLMLLTTQINSQDYYSYKGKRILLQQRLDKIAVILNGAKISEQEVSSRLQNLLLSGDKLVKAGKSVYVINFTQSRQPADISTYMESVKRGWSYIKFITPVYFGTSKSVTQIPTDRILVKLKSNRDVEKIKSFTATNDCVIEGQFGEGDGFIISTKEGDARNGLVLSDLYYSSGYFEYAEPDFVFPERCLLLSVPNDPMYPIQWALKNSGQLIQTGSPFLIYGDASSVNGIPGADMNVESAWDITTGSENVKIGIIDTGIDSLHPDLQMSGHILPGYDAFNDLEGSAIDVGNHGTSTAGLAGAVMNNGIGISGVAPSCPIMSICIFDINGSSSSIIIARAFDTARVRGIDVLSNSWGGGTPQSIITDAVDNAALNGRNGLGCVILFASGNDGRNPPIYPAVLPNVICVGGSTPHDQAKAPGTGNQFFWGSNYGEDEMGDLDLIAPTNCATLLSGGGYEENFWGTSATCPNAAGVAALVLSVNPVQTRIQVYENILRGCDKTDNVPYNIQKQFGKWSHYYGYGRINALNSMKLAMGDDITPPAISHENVSSTASTYPVIINAEITDQNGNSVPVMGEYQPKVFYKIKKTTSAWTAYDSVTAYSVSGNNFSFKIPSMGWETQVKYYIKAFDNAGNITTFPKHAPNPFWTCYYAVGNITSEKKKIPRFTGADFGATLSNAVSFSSFNILNAKFVIHMRHTYLDDEVIQILSPIPDANNNRKCLFSTNGNDGDNIYGAEVYDLAQDFWSNSTPPYLSGSFKPEYNLRGLNGFSAGGSWRILHFDRSLTDYAFFDSVFIILSRTTGTPSPSVRLNQPSDSIVDFGDVTFPEIAEKNFYLKNTGTSSMSIPAYSFEGEFAELFSLVNTPVTSVAPNDSALFRIKLNTLAGNYAASGMNGAENAVFKVMTNDPSKPEFRISLQTSRKLVHNPKNLDLNVLIEGLYNPNINQMISDSIKVYLRNSTAPYAAVDSSFGIIDQTGHGTIIFDNAENNTAYYIVVKHRNSIETWSAVTMSFIDSLMSYNFTVSDTTAYGNNLVQEGSRFCIFSGDVNFDGSVDAEDAGRIGNSAIQYQTGYKIEDLSGDLIIDAADNMIVDNNVRKYIIVVSP